MRYLLAVRPHPRAHRRRPVRLRRPRCRAPRSRSPSRRNTSGRPARSRSRSRRPAAKLGELPGRLRAERQADAALLARRSRAGADIKQDGADRVRITRADRQADAIPELQDRAGAHRRHRRRGRCSSACARRSRRRRTTSQVRLEPPRIAVVSTHHYVNHGGSEMVVYRATPADVDVGRARRRRRVSRAIPATGARSKASQRRPGDQGRVLRAALRPGR